VGGHQHLERDLLTLCALGANTGHRLGLFAGELAQKLRFALVQVAQLLYASVRIENPDLADPRAQSCHLFGQGRQLWDFLKEEVRNP